MDSSNDDRLPFTCLVPDTPGYIDIRDQTAALYMTVVDRADIGSLPDSWDKPGVYLLLDPIHPADETWFAYVGKAPSGVRSRMGDHLKKKDHWRRAILIRRDTTDGFQSSHTAWLEGRLYDLILASANGSLHNIQRPSDDTVPRYDQRMLEMAIDPIARVLRLLGYDPTTPAEAASKTATVKAKRISSVTLPQLLKAGLVEPGPLRSTNGSYPGSGNLLASGEIEVDGKPYSSPSAAAGALREAAGASTTAANGWDYWAVPTSNGDIRLSTLRAEYEQANSVTAGRGE